MKRRTLSFVMAVALFATLLAEVPLGVRNVNAQSELDTSAPVIQLKLDEIHVKTGTIPSLKTSAIDDSGIEPTLTYVWSEGALDLSGRLVKGTHTWTVHATDRSNHQASKTVKVYVTDNEHTNGKVFDEEALYKAAFPCENGHKKVEHKEVKATCSKNGTARYWSCSVCKKLFSDSACKNEIKSVKVLKASGHKLRHIKAVASTYTKAGKKAYYKCSVCGKAFLDSKGKKTATTASLTVKKKTVPGTNLKKVTPKKKALEIRWTKKSGVSGYQIQVSTKKNFKSSLKTVKVSGATKTVTTIKKLKAKKTYYVRIRCYKKVGKKTYYSAWGTKTMKKKTK